MARKTIIMHALYEPVYDENGHAYDALCHGGNDAFVKFYGLNPKGKMRSEFLSVSNLLIVRRMDEILRNDEPMAFSYEEKELGVLDVIMEPHGDGKCVDIYTISMIESKKMQERVNSMFRKYYAAVVMNNLAVWEWDIKEEKVYADNVFTDPTGKEQVDLERGQMVWNDEDRLADIYSEDQPKLRELLYGIRDGKFSSGCIHCRIMHEGQLIECEIRATLDRYDKDGKPDLVVATTRIL